MLLLLLLCLLAWCANHVATKRNSVVCFESAAYIAMSSDHAMVDAGAQHAILGADVLEEVMQGLQPRGFKVQFGLRKLLNVHGVEETAEVICSVALPCMFGSGTKESNRVLIILIMDVVPGSCPIYLVPIFFEIHKLK